MSALRVIRPGGLRKGDLILAVYGMPDLRLDDGLVSTTGERGLLSTSCVEHVRDLGEGELEVYLKDGSTVLLQADLLELEVASA